MNSATQTCQFEGPAGLLEGLCDVPTDMPIQGTAVIAHPHPLFGGTMQNKVVGAPSVSTSEVSVPVPVFMTKAAVN